MGGASIAFISLFFTQAVFPYEFVDDFLTEKGVFAL
jgi:hypothetical protein